MSNKDEDLDTRVAVVETKVENIEIQQVETKKHLKEIYEVSQDLRQKISKQNGILPRMETSLISIESKMDEIAINAAVTSSKLKVLWVVFGTVGGLLTASLVAYIFKMIFGN